jgi:hypothetical protein
VVAAELVADSRLDEVQPGVFVDVVVRVSVVLIVEVDGSRIRLSGSAVPRRSIIY